MKIENKIEKLINEQIVHEMASSNLYLSMSAYFADQNLTGFAHWMKLQAKEELEHAMKFYDYLIDRGGRVKLGQIPAQPVEWESPLKAFQDAHKHEQDVTDLINNIINASIEEKDHATREFLNWFVKEQVEEEASADEIVQKLKMVTTPGGLLMMDHSLGKRGKQ